MTAPAGAVQVTVRLVPSDVDSVGAAGAGGGPGFLTMPRMAIFQDCVRLVHAPPLLKSRVKLLSAMLHPKALPPSSLSESVMSLEILW